MKAHIESDLEYAHRVARENRDIESGFTSKNSIAILWHIDDVKSVIKDCEMKIELTDKECMEVLSFINLKLDTTLGVSWDTIEWAIKEYFKEKLEEKWYLNLLR